MNASAPAHRFLVWTKKSTADARVASLQLPSPPRTPCALAPAPLPVANAGACLLWPLLPPLWRQLGVLGDKTFFDEPSQHNAACWLDEIVWGRRPPDPARLVLNRLLCKLPQEVSLRPSPAAGVRDVLDGFVASLPQRSPAWATLGVAGIREQFLQRPGWVAGGLDGPRLYVQPQPCDVLLDQMPWPTEMMLLPWFERPWSVHWAPPRPGSSCGPDTPLPSARSVSWQGDRKR